MTSELIYPNKPNYGNAVSVHDPSIIYADDTYYAFGSHFAVSSSKDLITWHQVTGDGGSNRLYEGDWRGVLSDAVDHVGSEASSTWAPGMIKIDDTYYMYYSLSTFGSQTSYIGRVESKNILGPYTNNKKIVKSVPSNGPNAIDAEVFFDNDGKLWMVYGSFFGGIYIKELYASGEKVGLPIEEGFGKKIWNGSNNGPEGPYIFYNEETEYYYLMVSHGSLSTNYNMRIARSKNPDGPYLDTRNRDVSENSSGGIKLAGNYQFTNTQGYAAQGHNSVIKVEDKYLAVYHTRFRQGEDTVSGHHNVFVSQILFDKEGWPVLSPSRYAGESLQELKKGDLVGSYDLVLHTGGNNEGFASSNVYTFNSDGTIEEGGTWEFIGPHYIEFTLGIKSYSGVVIPTWDHHNDRATLSISAVSYRDGMTLWANKII